MGVRIISIADRPELVSTIGRWHWEEWGHVDPDGSLGTWTARLAEEINRDAIPTIFVALVDDVAVGSVSLIPHDLPGRADLADLSPWLAGLYVVPEHRGRGVGTALVRHCESQARAMGAARLYLYTAPARAFYEGLDWVPIGDDHHEGAPITIMAKPLADPDALDEEETSWLATLRQSRIREVQGGASAWTSVGLGVCDNGSEGQTLRGALEALRVTTTPPQQLSRQRV